jgi:hypothetical protein
MWSKHSRRIDPINRSATPSPSLPRNTTYHPKSRSWKQVGAGYRFVASWKFRKIANCEAVQVW